MAALVIEHVDEPQGIPDRTYKLILAGEGGVGKTTWVESVRVPRFEPRYIPTLGVDLHPLRVSHEERLYQFNIWDLAGQEGYAGLNCDELYRGAECALIFHDLTNEASFHAIPKWLNRVQNLCGQIPIVIVGTKSDLPDAVHRVFPGFTNCTVNSKSGNKANKIAPLLTLVDFLD